MKNREHTTIKNNENKQLIVLGDKNCDYFKNPSESHTQRLKFISSTYQLLQLITKLTRMKDRSATLIDLIFNTEYKTFSVLMYSYINTSEIGKTRNCMETRRPKGGVFSHDFEFSQLPRVLI